MSIDERRLSQHRYRAADLVSRFTVPYLREAYRQFDGDLLLVLVLGEVAMRNVGVLFQRPLASGEPETRFGDLSSPDQLLRPCNALSVSEATGVPRETVRRKVATLLERGWLQRTRAGHLYLTPAVARRFESFTQSNIESLLEVAQSLGELLRPPVTGEGGGRPRGAAAPRRPRS